MKVSEVEVVNNSENNRFEIRIKDLIAKIFYNIKDNSIGFFHTHVPEEWRGKGIAKKMTECALNYAKDNNLRVLPYCSFVAEYIKKHPEWECCLHIRKRQRG